MMDDQVPFDTFSSVTFTPIDNVINDVMFAASPDSYSFQHFLDRVAMMLAQTYHLRSSETQYITKTG